MSDSGKRCVTQKSNVLRFPKVFPHNVARYFGKVESKTGVKVACLIAQKTLVCLAPLGGSGTKTSVLGLENFRVEWL